MYASVYVPDSIVKSGIYVCAFICAFDRNSSMCVRTYRTSIYIHVCSVCKQEKAAKGLGSCLTCIYHTQHTHIMEHLACNALVCVLDAN